MAFTTRVLKNKYPEVDGAAAVGTIVIEPNARLVSGVENAVVPQSRIAITLDVNGAFSLALITTDNAGITPTGWAYTISEYVKGAPVKIITVPVPSGGGDLELADVTPYDPAPALVQYVQAGTVGQAGGPAGPLDGSGKIPAGQIPGGGGGGSVTSVNGVAPVTGNVQLAAADIPAATVGHNHAGTYDPSGTASAALSAHVAAGDPHTQYALEASLGNSSALNVGTGAGTVAAGNDARMTDARTPLAHAATHAAAGGDPVTLTQAQITNLVADLAAKLAASDVRLSQHGHYPPAGYGFIALSDDPNYTQVPGSFGSNTILFRRVFVPANRSITGVYFALRAGSAQDGVNFGNKVTVFDDAGLNPISSAVDETLWTTGGWRGAPLLSTIAPQAVDRYVYALALVRGHAGGVGFCNPSGANDSNGPYTAIGVSQPKRRGGYWNGQTAIPATIDPTTIGTASGFTVCCGLTGA